MEPRNMTAWKLVSSLICFIGGFILPVRGDEIQHPALEDAPRITRTMTGIHGDPICVGLIGTKEEIIAAMLTAKWQPADAITFKSSVKLARSIVLHHPDETAPVSNLYLWKRKEDLAFEQEVGKDAPPSPRSVLGVRKAGGWSPVVARGSNVRHEGRIQPQDGNDYPSHRCEH